MQGTLVLVTGGAGFVGAHLCRRLVAEGYRVISLDNYFTGSKENHVGGVEYREGHTKDIDSLVPETPEYIYHLGEYSRVAKSIEEPMRVWDLNILGTIHVLEFWRARKSKLIYAGSSTKLSDTRDDGIEGKDLSPYTWSKAANTELVRNYARWYGLPYATAYFYNVYGPGERAGDYGTVIEIFRQAAQKGEALKVNAPGTQRRIYTHIDDTVNALVLVAQKGEGDEYGIGSSDDYATIEVAKLFSDNIQMMPARKTSRPSSLVDTSKIKALGWKQEHHLDEYVASLMGR